MFHDICSIVWLNYIYLDRNENEDFYIIDENSLLRNYILVNSAVMGGPNERLLPTKTIENDAFERCLFSKFPVPDCYYCNMIPENPETVHVKMYILYIS